MSVYETFILPQDLHFKCPDKSCLLKVTLKAAIISLLPLYLRCSLLFKGNKAERKPTRKFLVFKASAGGLCA
jgi:hypothetical protein